MRILFMGTPDFAEVVLSYIVSAGHEVVSVISQPDRKKGRGQKVVYTPVHQFAEEKGLSFFAPESIKNGELMEVLESTKPDMIVVVAYGKILPEYVLNYPKFGCINVHASLLPKYRGAAPIQWAVINGEKTTGVTTMFMEKGLDTGDMLLKEEVAIGDDETSEELFNRLSHVGGKLILKTIEMAEKGELEPEKQNESESSYASMIDKKMGLISWSDNVFKIKNLVRGLNSWPLAYTYYKGSLLKVGSVNVYEEAHNEPFGKIKKASSKEGLFVYASGGVIEILTCQAEGKKMMSAKDYLMGHSLEIGEILGGN